MTQEQRRLMVAPLYGDAAGFGSQEMIDLVSKLSDDITAHNVEVQRYFADRENAQAGNVSAADAVEVGKRLADLNYTLPAKAVELVQRKLDAMARVQSDLASWRREQSEKLREAEQVAEKKLVEVGLTREMGGLAFEENLRWLTRKELSYATWTPTIILLNNVTTLGMELNEKREALGRALTATT